MFKNIPLKGYVSWIIGILFFFYEFTIRTILGTFQVGVVQDLALSAFQFALLSTTVFMVVACVMQIPIGFFINRFGIKYTLAFGAFISALGCLGFSLTNDYYVAVIWRFVMSFGSCFAFVCLLYIIYDWLPGRYVATYIGLSQFFATLGPVFAAGPLNDLAQSGGVSWREVFFSLFIMGFALAIMSLLFVRKKYSKAGQYRILNRPYPVIKQLKEILKRRQVWAIALFTACVYCAVEYLTENEGTTFLQTKGIPLNRGAYALTVAWIGYAFGCPILGSLSDSFKRRKPIVIFGAISSAIAILTIMLAYDFTIITGAFFLLGISASSQSVGFSLMGDQFQEAERTLALGFCNTLLQIVCAVNAPAIGVVLDCYKNHVKNLGHMEYQMAFIILLVTIFVAFILAFFSIKETYAKLQSGFTIIRNC